MNSDKFDYVVLGGGSGGLASARRAAKHGARVVLVEAARLGGTCVNLGCVPKKMTYSAAFVAETLEDAEAYGFEPVASRIDYAKFKRKRDAEVSRLNGVYERSLATDGVALFRGVARLDGPNVVVATDESGAERRFEAPAVLLATGGRPRVPAISGSELGETSDGFFAWETLPQEVAIVGAGYIGVELACSLAALGSRVTLVIRGERLLSGFDALVAEVLALELEARGVSLVFQFPLTHIEKRGGRLVLRDPREREVGPVDRVLFAVGRDPNTRGIGIDSLGILGPGGHVVVDEWQSTKLPGLFAVGDVTGKKDLTPVAIAAGRRLADRLFGGDGEAKLDYDDVPTVVFTHPPIAAVGLSESEAEARFGPENVKCYVTRFTDTYHVLGRRRVPTAMKLVTATSEERVVGLFVIGRGADEMIQGFAVAIRMGAKKSDFDRTVAVHPTAAEELVTLR